MLNDVHGRVQPGNDTSAAHDGLRELATAAGGGNELAARRLIRHVAPHVMDVVRRALGSGHPDHEDMTQEALVGFVQALPAYRGDCSVIGYARRITLWRVLAERKRERALKRAVLTAHDADPDASEANETTLAPSSVAKSADDQLANARRRQLLRELLDELPEAQAQALAMRHVLGNSIQEIATACQVPANTVRSRLRLAKEALRARIEADPRLSELNSRTASGSETLDG